MFEDQSTGERHIADVHTLAGLSIEIQHSHLDPNERRAGETFYQNMLWVVDGSRLKGNREKILGWQEALVEISQGGQRTNLFLTGQANDLFPSDWLDSSAPICFDYRGPNAETSSAPTMLFLLYPGKVQGGRLVESLTRDGLLRAIYSERVSLPAVRSVLQNVSQLRLSKTRR